jgi:uncharacterized glyoxalase superfamily protein PhnB
MAADEAVAMADVPPVTFQTPSIGLLTRDVPRLVVFYQGLGFRETYRYPREGPPEHVEVKLGDLTLGISSVDAAVNRHGLSPNLSGRPVYIVLWTRDTDAAYARLTAHGAASLRPPHDFLTDLRTAWVADPDGNPINVVQRRG